MEWEIISTTARLDEVMRRPGLLLELFAEGGGDVTRYTGAVPCEHDEPHDGEFERVAYVTAKALRDWVGEPGTPGYREPNGPFCSTWVLPGMDIWNPRAGLSGSACGDFVVDLVAETLTFRPSSQTLAIADVLAGGLQAPPRDMAQQVVLRRALAVLAEALPDDHPLLKLQPPGAAGA